MLKREPMCSGLVLRQGVSVWPWHLEMIGRAREDRIHGGHGGSDLFEGYGVCRSLAQSRRADGGGRLDAVPGIDRRVLSRQAASGGAATPRSGCSTAWAAA